MELYYKLRDAQNELSLALMANNKRMINRAIKRLEALKKAYGIDN